MNDTVQELEQTELFAARFATPGSTGSGPVGSTSMTAPDTATYRRDTEDSDT